MTRACRSTWPASTSAMPPKQRPPRTARSPRHPTTTRNETDQLRMPTVDPDTPVTWYASGDPNDEITGTYAEWIDFLATQESYLGIWVTVESGTVTEIAERWVP